MVKQTILKWVNVVLFLAILGQAASILSMKAFPDSFGFAYPWHIYGGYAFGAVLLAHLALNMTWVKNVLLKRTPKKPS